MSALPRLLCDIEEVGDEGYQFISVLICFVAPPYQTDKYCLESFGYYEDDGQAIELSDFEPDDVDPARNWIQEWRDRAEKSGLSFELKPDVETFLREVEAKA